MWSPWTLPTPSSMIWCDFSLSLAPPPQLEGSNMQTSEMVHAYAEFNGLPSGRLHVHSLTAFFSFFEAVN
jgi:hypothetical protein